MPRTALAFLLLLTIILPASAQKIGVFDSSTGVGITPQAGSAAFDSASGEYRITGGGANMWLRVDAFHFLWTKMSGDLAITADIKFIGESAAAHRKAALLIRQNLEPGSAYADVAVHGDGLTSLQYRPTADALTQEVRSELKGPTRVRIERRGDRITILAGNPGEQLKPAGPVAMSLQDPVYVGLGVCSHNADVLETALFSNVTVERLPQVSARPRVRSKLSIYNLEDNSTRVIHTADRLFEAPNWSRDGSFLLINAGGNLYRVPVNRDNPEPEKIDLGEIGGCNNDHGISPDG
ncbi:MAG: TolB family protein, partial [Bryobacteraceae bacterium]